MCVGVQLRSEHRPQPPPPCVVYDPSIVDRSSASATCCVFESYRMELRIARTRARGWTRRACLAVSDSDAAVTHTLLGLSCN